ncbi:MAG: Holliday junction resolvase RuvX [Candidatus Yonathbacteria bacterium]|nr:Holliday junction resolvase RuvX [Candidatus Yonathbacteria bacterium]
MRYLGIDYGTKRVGVAISDEGGTLAFPYAILDNGKGLVGEIKNICAHESVGAIVVGESLDYKGKPNPIMTKTNTFIKEIKEIINIPIILEREFLTTQQARFFQTERKRVDDSAAAIILQSYLDRKGNKPIPEKTLTK